MTLISIGILAYNEERNIARTIESVLHQQPDSPSESGTQHAWRAELVVVPNGCDDRTAAVARDTIAKYMPPPHPDGSGFVEARVCELEAPGKENAWNHFVSHFSDPEADVLVFMDADVELAHDQVLANLVVSLLEHPECVIAGGQPVKHIERKNHKSVGDKISIGASRLRAGMKGMFAGCLYCGRAKAVRQMYLPTVLMGEDAFVRAMTVTRGFTAPDDPSLVVRAVGAEVIFEAYTAPSEVLRNKTRRMLELAINAIIYTQLWEHSTPECPAGPLMRRWQSEDPNWSQKLVDKVFANRGFWAVPKLFIYKQFLQLKNHAWPKRIKLLPVAVVTLPLNAVAVIRANRMVARGEIRKLWDKPT